MPGLGLLTVVGLLLLAVLVVVYLKLRQKDLLDEVVKKRQATNPKIITRAEYVEGVNSIPVAMAIAGETLYYENSDLEASFDLDRIEEVEYADDLATGRAVNPGKHVLRLRSHGATFEFVMDDADEKKWEQILPPRRVGQQRAAHAV